MIINKNKYEVLDYEHKYINIYIHNYGENLVFIRCWFILKIKKWLK